MPTDVASALRTALAELGHRPAVTVLSPRGREEQGVASLAQWAAKGAHLLELDLLLGPDEQVALDAPLSWTSAAVCLAAWWAGVAIDLDGDAEVAVVHESRQPHGAADVLWLGDAVDGAPVGEVDGEPWVRAVQAFPDQPPAPQAEADRIALRSGARAWTQRELLAMAAELGADPAAEGGRGSGDDRGTSGGSGASGGTLGLHADALDPVTGLVAVALRPLVTGRPTVVLQGVDRAAADGEKVRVWLPDA